MHDETGTKAQTSALSAVTLDATELAKRCPAGWNVFELKNTYAREGFKYHRAINKILIKKIGSGSVPPEDLPVPCRVPVVISGVDERGFLVFAAPEADAIEVGERAEVSVEESGRCRGPDDKPALTRQYLEEHDGIAWDYRDMREVYAVLGYGAARAAAEQVLAAAGDGAIALPVKVEVLFEVNTTWLGGGCQMICVNKTCQHFPNDSGNAPGDP